MSCPVNVVINYPFKEFHTLIVLSRDPLTISVIVFVGAFVLLFNSEDFASSASSEFAAYSADSPFNEVDETILEAELLPLSFKNAAGRASNVTHSMT